MKILAIETSCDDTGIAILEGSGNRPCFKILSNVVASQIEIHKKYGGVFPALAKREHQKNLIPALFAGLEKAGLLSAKQEKIPAGKIKILKKILEREESLFSEMTGFFSNWKKPDIQSIAITEGPGLEPCLWVGVNFAKALSFFWGISIIPVDHVRAHILANFLCLKKDRNLFPAVSLAVSGGHTRLSLMKNLKSSKTLGDTRDDAAGECFDKIAKILGLEYPGGPVISKLAENGRPEDAGVSLPRPMMKEKSFDFSFSGLKTAVLYHHRKQTPARQKSKKFISGLAAESQQAIIDVLEEKTFHATRKFKAKSVLLGGGVASNKKLREVFAKSAKKEKVNFLAPSTDLCTDNAVMIGIAGFYAKKTRPWRILEAKANLGLK